MGGSVDAIEKQIILLLQEDGRIPTAEIARRLSISEPTARKKLALLLSSGVIHIGAIADPTNLGYAAPAYIGLDVERRQIKSVAARLADYPMVSSVAVSTGPYDIIIEAAFETITALYEFVLNDLAEVKGIIDSHSFIVLQRFKQGGLRGVAEDHLRGKFGRYAACR